MPRLLIRRLGENIRVSAPQIRFLTGRSLEQLKNGASVGFVSQIVLSANELSRVDRVPSFVFSNACESGITPSRSDLRSPKDRPT